MSTELFSWRKCIFASDLHSTTRYVLLTLSTYMNEHGTDSYPSTRRLAHNTGLSERTICTHLELAAKAGWIVKQDAGLRGQKWRSNKYHSAIPENANLVTYSKAIIDKKGTEGGSARLQKGAEPHAKGTEPHDIKVLKEVQCTTSYNSPSNTPLAEDPEKKLTRHEMLNAIAEKYNRLLSGHKKTQHPQPIHHGRQSRLKEIIDSYPDFSDLGIWEWFFSGVDELQFWNGRDPDKPFRRNFDYFLNLENFAKLVDEVEDIEPAEDGAA